jgi:hypothetical protein
MLNLIGINQMNYTTDSSTFSVTLSLEAHSRAKQFCDRASNPQKAKQIYLNTLAVYAVDFYLQCLGFKPELEKSDSWNPLMQTLMNVADLQVENLGKLECRAVLPNSQFCYVPPEVWEERIGYVAVQLNESLREATLLGFVKEVKTEKLPLSLLKPLEDLRERIRELKSLAVAANAPAVKKQVHLSQWLNNIFEAGWETVESLFDPPQTELAFRFRSAIPTRSMTLENPEFGITRGKLLGLERSGDQVALFVGLKPTASSEMDIWVELYPINGKVNLPEDLQLMVLNEQGEAVMQAQAKSTKNIQLKFGGQPGEGFGVKVALGDVSITEPFLI